MIKNIELHKMHESNIRKEFKNLAVGKYSFNYLNSDFVIDTKFFFPISIKSFETSTDLFAHYSRFKYEIFFHKTYYEFIKKNLTKMIFFNNSFVVGSSNNYYHLLLDWIPRLFTLNKVILEKVDNIVFSSEYLKNNKVIQSILVELKINKEKIFLEKGSYLFKNSYIPANLSLEEKIFFHRKLLSKYIKTKNSNKIYISRQDSSNRRITNENDLIIFLKKQNFIIIELSKYNFLEQISIISNAKNIISMHGAGLSNIIY
mgnify:CR=1 FL=1